MTYSQAPESLTKNMYSPKSDMWAFGLLIYEIYAGVDDAEDPFPAESLTRLAEEKKLVPKSLPASCPKDIAYIAAGCLRQDPTERLDAAGVLAILASMTGTAARLPRRKYIVKAQQT